MVNINSRLYNDYLDIISHADNAEMSNWKYIIDYLNTNVNEMSKFLPEHGMFCLQQPQGHGLLNQPFGQAFVKNCSLFAYAQDMFIIKNDGHVSSNIYLFICA